MNHVVSGSKVVVGLFDSLRQFTNQVGKLVNVVGDRLDDRRGDVVRIAGDVDSQVSILLSRGLLQTTNLQVHNLGQGIRNWKIKTFGFGLKEKSEKKISEDLEIGEDIIVVNSDNISEEEANEDTTIDSIIV